MVAKVLTLLIANFRTVVNIQVVMSFPFPKKQAANGVGAAQHNLLGVLTEYRGLSWR